MAQDVWAAVNAEQRPASIKDQKSAPTPESKLQAPPKVRQCTQCGKEGSGMVKCGGGCKKFSHPACIGKDDAFMVRLLMHSRMLSPMMQ